MADREKVIRGLEHCVGEDRPNCENCPYLMDLVGTGCYLRILRDAFALLKEQEARVMTREEVLSTPEGTVVWMEEKSESGSYVQPIVSNGNSFFGNFYLGVAALKVEFQRERFWTAQPTEEQRNEVAWDE